MNGGLHSDAVLESVGMERKLGPKIEPALIKGSPLGMAIDNIGKLPHVGRGIRKVAEFLGMSHAQLYAWRQRGKVPYWVPGDVLKKLKTEGQTSEEHLRAGVPEETLSAFRTRRKNGR